jgi:hypothetical protein
MQILSFPKRNLRDNLQDVLEGLFACVLVFFHDQFINDLVKCQFLLLSKS